MISVFLTFVQTHDFGFIVRDSSLVFNIGGVVSGGGGGVGGVGGVGGGGGVSGGGVSGGGVSGGGGGKGQRLHIFL
jgi:hypothetical protein